MSCSEGSENPPSFMTASDPFNLKRFVDAQSDIYQRVIAEIRGGHKRSHWMWFEPPREVRRLRWLSQAAMA